MSVRQPGQSPQFWTAHQFNNRAVGTDKFNPVSVYEAEHLPKYHKLPNYERHPRMMQTFGWKPPHLGKDDPTGPVEPETMKKFGVRDPWRRDLQGIDLMQTGFSFEDARRQPDPQQPVRDESLPELSAHNSYHHTQNLKTTRSVPYLRDWAGAWQQTLDDPMKESRYMLPKQKMGVQLNSVWAGRPTDLREPWGERDGEEWNKRGLGVNLPLRVGAPSRSGKIRSSAPIEVEPGVWAWRDHGATEALPIGPNVPNAHLVASAVKK
jgi:hypothetical protein